MPEPASISEQIREHFKLALLTAPQIPEVLDRVVRAREDAISEQETSDGFINIKAGDEAAQKFGTRVDQKELVVEIEIQVRAVQGQVWETKADVIAVKAHAKLLAYSSWPSQIAQIRHVGVDRGGDRGNRTPGKETHRYAVRFLNSAAALDQGPTQP